MLFYPQLSSGGTGQFPIARQETHRTVQSAMPSGATIRSSDAGADSVQWKLTYSHLTDAEWAAIEALYKAAQGRLLPFTFLDPTDNLLVWSSDLTKSVWTTDPMVTVGGGIGDPNGGTGAFQLTNGGQAQQGVGQTLPAPAGLIYAFSVYVSSAAPESVSLVATDGTAALHETVNTAPGWTRVQMQSLLASGQGAITFRIELATGTQVNVFGPQVEAQPTASLYKATAGRGGVYPESRFSQDAIQRVSTGVNQNAAAIQIFTTIPD
jgi:hypothetical protein